MNTVPLGASQNIQRGEHQRSRRPATGPSPTIKHVVIIIQENRSFNNLFGGPHPFPNATATAAGYESNGTKVTLSKIEFEFDPQCDLGHYYSDAISALNASSTGAYQMNGFNKETWCSGSANKTPYAYVDYAETKPYWFMASHWGLGDHFYPTELGPSFTAHLNWIASTDEIAKGKAVVNFPNPWVSSTSDCDALAAQNPSYSLLYGGSVHQKNGWACFWQFHTMADFFHPTGANASPTWRYYAPSVSNEGGKIWSEFEAIEQVWCGTSGPISAPCSGGPEAVNVVTPSRQILSDVANGNLASLTWVVPTLRNSDHQQCNFNGTTTTGKPCTGPAWVASVVNAIGNSKFWDSTVIIVTWDDWGGWYDEDSPPMYDFRGKGIRTPIIVISPYNIQGSSYYYGGHGWVSHDQYEPGSVLKFVEQVFNFPTLGSSPCNTFTYSYSQGCNLGYTDSTAVHSISDNMLDFSQSPRAFTPVPTPNGYGNSYFNFQPESASPPDTE